MWANFFTGLGVAWVMPRRLVDFLVCRRGLRRDSWVFNIPNLHVGTLDSLLSLSDDLIKSNSFVEGVTHKIRRQIEEMERLSGVESNALTVDGVPVDSYLTRGWCFVKIEDDPKVRVAEYNTVRSQLNAITRKQSGSLAVRDLSNLVKPEDIITSEHLVTLLAIVPKYSQKDWLVSYDKLCGPRSSKKLYEDNEYALYSVTLFCRVADNFRTSARDREELEKLMQDQERLRNSLLQWCYTSYGEVFSSWMHFSAVHVFVESILRYGLPPSFLACVLAPSVRSEKKVQSILEGLCDSANRQLGNSYWKTNDEIGGMVGLAADTDVHPYVCFTINLV
ncbi:hypothetical protein I3842_Q002700 [Carya illinoinensis]|uniref:V-type proton ATPase subunit C n=1 Tax=Carya illinoinensis TaxID=32201 RepID=A0A922D7Z0_CARIL|nr:hypothetical protein I3842_Q002700 [Carya illinoinensis]